MPGIETRQVDLIMDTSLIFNTSKFSGFDYPLTSFVLPLQQFRMLSVNNKIFLMIDIFRNVSTILSPSQIGWVMVDSKISRYHLHNFIITALIFSYFCLYHFLIDISRYSLQI